MQDGSARFGTPATSRRVLPWLKDDASPISWEDNTVQKAPRVLPVCTFTYFLFILFSTFQVQTQFTLNIILKKRLLLFIAKNTLCNKDLVQDVPRHPPPTPSQWHLKCQLPAPSQSKLLTFPKEQSQIAGVGVFFPQRKVAADIASSSYFDKTPPDSIRLAGWSYTSAVDLLRLKVQHVNKVPGNICVAALTISRLRWVTRLDGDDMCRDISQCNSNLIRAAI